MNSSKKLFETFLAEKAHEPWYDKTSNWVLVVLWWILWAFCHDSGNLLLEMFPWIIFFIWLAFYLYKNRIMRVGKLEVFLTHFQITENNKRRIFNFDKLNSVSIQRGSNYHSYDVGEEIRMENNYLRFVHEGQAYEFLFIISSYDKNKEFENMIASLRNEGLQFHYSSI